MLIPIVKTEAGPAVLFEVRAKTLKRQPGEICFPGGKYECADNSFERTAIRETCEELGLQTQDIEICGELDSLVTHMGPIIHPFVGLLYNHQEITFNPDEVEEVFAKMDLALICEEKYNSLKQFDWVVYTILKNQEGLSKRSYLMGNKSYVDKYNNVFVRISQKKLAKLLKTSIPTLRNSLNRLVEVELLEIHVVGQNECNIMYIGNPVRTITFGEYVENIGKALEDEDNVKDFKPSINVDNVKEYVQLDVSKEVEIIRILV